MEFINELIVMFIRAAMIEAASRDCLVCTKKLSCKKGAICSGCLLKMRGGCYAQN